MTATISPTSVESDLRRELSEKIARGALELPLLSNAATSIVTMCVEGKADARALADTLHRDPALAGHVLRVANSPAYAPIESIVSLQQAVSRLGLTTLGQIAFAVAVGSRVFDVPGHEAWVADMWRHAALTGGWAREIARERRRNVEGAFVCGLLHDVGEPVLLQEAVDLLAQAKCSATRAELAPVMHELHAVAGAKLVEAWKMAPWMIGAVAHHHAPENAANFADEAYTTQLADELAHWTSQQPDEDLVDALARLRGLAALEPLNFYEDELERLLARRAKVVEFAGALQR
jgi:putative nucleotidyltransferase with HDIG domain